jgi:predicted nucleotidyltransferase
MNSQRPTLSVPDEIRPLVEAIRHRFNPEAVWLFGSRARGDHRPDSDWDIVVELPDDCDPELLDPIVGWTIKHDLGIAATVLSTTGGALARSWGEPNTIGYLLARDGLLLDG